jgi:DNA integrity scanning protein DisA with diadenylate cyclase activity
MVEKLHDAAINSVRDLYEAPEERLDAIDYVGETRVKQLKNAVAQVWVNRSFYRLV